MSRPWLSSARVFLRVVYLRQKKKAIAEIIIKTPAATPTPAATATLLLLFALVDLVFASAEVDELVALDPVEEVSELVDEVVLLDPVEVKSGLELDKLALLDSVEEVRAGLDKLVITVMLVLITIAEVVVPVVDGVLNAGVVVADVEAVLAGTEVDIRSATVPALVASNFVPRPSSQHVVFAPPQQNVPSAHLVIAGFRISKKKKVLSSARRLSQSKA